MLLRVQLVRHVRGVLPSGALSKSAIKPSPNADGTRWRQLPGVLLCRVRAAAAAPVHGCVHEEMHISVKPAGARRQAVRPRTAFCYLRAPGPGQGNLVEFQAIRRAFGLRIKKVVADAGWLC